MSGLPGFGIWNHEANIQYEGKKKIIIIIRERKEIPNSNTDLVAFSFAMEFIHHTQKNR